MSGDELWLDVFYFVIDEIDSPSVLNRFLHEIIAYAIATKRADVGRDVRTAYEREKLNEDVVQTPAAV